MVLYCFYLSFTCLCVVTVAACTPRSKSGCTLSLLGRWSLFHVRSCVWKTRLPLLSILDAPSSFMFFLYLSLTCSECSPLISVRHDQLQYPTPPFIHPFPLPPLTHPQKAARNLKREPINSSPAHRPILPPHPLIFNLSLASILASNLSLSNRVCCAVG